MSWRGSARGLPLGHPAALLATWFGTGLLPWAPGSWGSLAALPFGWAIARVWGAPALLAATALLFVAGWWAADVTARALGVVDPSAVVVDEVAGQWLVLAAAPREPLYYLAAFLLFRFFDVLKPWPASWADREIGGGLGIMADDALAALYAALLLLIGRQVLAG